MPQGLSINNIEVGHTHRKTVTMTEEMMISFTHSLGDHQSFHQDPDMAKDTFFGRIVAPGMLTASLLGFVLGTEYPGLGTIYVSQELNFTKPVYAGDELTISVTVEKVMPKRNRVRLATLVENQEGQTVLKGMAEIIPPMRDAA
ncbi:MAG: MaoC family dehydratase [Desulfarculaceae bacterium]|nr:MaoC family dehydratase [Desulfarculaceae bacterium]MCF8046823.1 MaoC family dehydratase [Desulfarculaceae bacterium]MCF8097443.1 MaoC family dehydratase [Desulfarculaceae bacterium]MCF8121412.1 MaoC family dehydratase [Desulfarculaceae bacterium]